ncbi:somatostatin receptor type 5-like [Pomacea canaliculata]|uniref:somatostatin receptor type 5-like n=1 Tax=Pomacea canaliculata TaxID=400727 RepID=UPI000D72C324|nr:somatostatin receptor type 5-like [Pomacea canaliculata]
METLDIAQGNNSENSHVTSMAWSFTRQPIVTEVPFNYLADDAALLRYTEFRVALWIDYIYVPICASFGIAGNLLSMRVLLPSRMSESSTCVYMAAMSASDIIIQICNILFLVRKFEGHEVLTTGSCGLIYFLFFFSIHSNVIVMVVMTAERYLAISHPLQAGQWFSKRKAQLAVVVTWVLVLMIDLHHLIIRRMDWNDALQMEVCVPVGATSKYFTEKIWPWLDGALYCYIPFFSVLIFNILIVHQMNVSNKFRESNIRGGRTETADKQVKPTTDIFYEQFFNLIHLYRYGVNA